VSLREAFTAEGNGYDAAQARKETAVLLTLLALAVPMQAFALNSDGSEPVAAHPAPAALTVSTSVDSCGIATGQVVCKLDVSYKPISGADTYTATVTRADGSVIDYGSVAAGDTSLWVPYVGAGSYSVRITAYGSPPHEGGRGNVVATGSDKPTAEATISDGRGNNTTAVTKPGSRQHKTPATEVEPTSSPGNDGAGSTAASAEQTTPTAPPECDPNAAPTPAPTAEAPVNPPPPDNDPNNDDEDSDGVSDAQELAAVAAGIPLHYPPTTAQPPQSVNCPAP
jgi:hypothetical protein